MVHVFQRLPGWMLGDSQGIYALILTASTDLPWWRFCSKAHKKKKPTFLRNGGNQFREYWNFLKALEVLSERELKRKTWKEQHLWMHSGFRSLIHHMAPAGCKGSKRSIQTTSGRSCQDLVARLGPLAASGLCHGSPGPAAHEPSPEQRPWHGRRNGAREGQQKGTLIFVSVNLCLLLWPDLVPKDSQQ